MNLIILISLSNYIFETIYLGSINIRYIGTILIIKLSDMHKYIYCLEHFNIFVSVVFINTTHLRDKSGLNKKCLNVRFMILHKKITTSLSLPHKKGYLFIYLCNFLCSFKQQIYMTLVIYSTI